MNEDTKDLLSGGYCFSIKDSGPFVIGKDFEAPGPAGRIIPRMKIDREKRDELAALVIAPGIAGAAGAGAPSGGGETTTQSPPAQQKKSHVKKN